MYLLHLSLGITGENRENIAKIGRKLLVLLLIEPIVEDFMEIKYYYAHNLSKVRKIQEKSVKL